MTLDLRKLPAYYINLEREIGKREKTERLLSSCGFEKVTRIEGVVPEILNWDKLQKAKSMAYLNALNSCREGGIPFVLFEDDWGIKDFKPIINIPDDTDALYLGISGWGIQNSHSGPFVQYRKKEGYNDLYKIYNMCSSHAILYCSTEYVNLYTRICSHSAEISIVQDIGFAEVQRWFNVYAFNNPMFFQYEIENLTFGNLLSRPSSECLDFQKNFFIPRKLV